MYRDKLEILANGTVRNPYPEYDGDETLDAASVADLYNMMVEAYNSMLEIIEVTTIRAVPANPDAVDKKDHKLCAEWSRDPEDCSIHPCADCDLNGSVDDSQG